MAYVRTARRQDGTPFFRAIWDVYDAQGRRRPQSKSFGKRSEAKSYAARMAIEIEQKGVGDPEKHDLSRYLRRWMATLRASGDYSPPTLLNYKHHVDRIIGEIGHIRLAKLTAADIDACYAGLLGGGLARGTVRATHSVLQTALTRARKWKFVATNVADDATPPKAARKAVRALTPVEVARLLVTASEPRRRGTYPGLDTIVHLALSTGLRRGEILGLAFDAVDLDASTLTVKRTVIEGEDRRPLLRDGTKTPDSMRTISISGELVERLRRQKVFILEQRVRWGSEYASGPLLCFPCVGGQPMHPEALATRFRVLLKRTGIAGVQPVHVFRHTHATWLMAGAANPKAVSKRLGHASVAFTLGVYTHPEQQEDRAVSGTMEALVEAARNAAEMLQSVVKVGETKPK